LAHAPAAPKISSSDQICSVHRPALLELNAPLIASPAQAEAVCADSVDPKHVARCMLALFCKPVNAAIAVKGPHQKKSARMHLMTQVSENSGICTVTSAVINSVGLLTKVLNVKQSKSADIGA